MRGNKHYNHMAVLEIGEGTTYTETDLTDFKIYSGTSLVRTPVFWNPHLTDRCFFHKMKQPLSKIIL